MTQFRNFEEIHAWQEARKLVREIRRICKREHVKRDFSFIDQITRSARSVSANIAEGNDAMTIPSFIEFLGYAKRSCAEVRSHLYDALDEHYITQNEFVRYADHTKKICAMLAKLIHHLQSCNTTLKRTLKESD
ncbi:MAG: four helix bundle protein [bacterium]|nr:four helix bundle protein [bacterium]MDA1292187.1 four helix bundle protein [bacterium]